MKLYLICGALFVIVAALTAGRVLPLWFLIAAFILLALSFYRALQRTKDPI